MSEERDDQVQDTNDSALVDALEVPYSVDDAEDTATEPAVETDEQVTEEQATVETTEPEPQTEPTTTAPDKPAQPSTHQHDFDKGLQKLQQEQAALARQFREFMQKMSEPKPEPPKPSKLDELLAKDDYDVDPNVKAIAAQLREVDERVQKSSEPVQQITQQLQAIQTQQWYDRFERQHGIPADDVFKATDEHFQGKQVSPDLYDYVFNLNAERLKAERAKPVEKPAARKPSTQPDKPTEGTRITTTKPSPAPSRRLTATGEIPDELVDDLIKGA